MDKKVYKLENSQKIIKESLHIYEKGSKFCELDSF